MSDHILAAVPSVSLSIPPTVANFCVSQTLTASLADCCSNRLVGNAWAIMLAAYSSAFLV